VQGQNITITSQSRCVPEQFMVEKIWGSSKFCAWNERVKACEGVMNTGGNEDDKMTKMLQEWRW